MKTNCWLILGTMLATTAVAQVNTNKLPEIPPPAIATPGAAAPIVMSADTTNAPAKKVAKAKKKKVAKKAKAAVKAVEKKALEMPVTLVAGPATVAGEHVNLRGQAGLKGEIVGHMVKGDTVTVISQINLDKPKAGEPAQWAKIALPAAIKVWIDSKYVDASNNVVAAKKLNLRGGPGENYSVLGVIEKGTAITAVANKGDWTQIEPPASAFAFVAASYLKQEGSLPGTAVPPSATPPPAVTTTEAVPPPAPPPTPTTVTEAQPIAPPATTPPPAEMAPPATPPVTPPPTPEATPTPAPVTPAMTLPEPTLAPDDTNLPPPPPRIVTHEGSVRHSVSLVAPTDFELYDPTDNKAINYLFSTTTNLNLGRYNGMHITVTGEEGLDARWKDTPVLTIQKIYVLSAPTPEKPVTKKHSWFSK